MKIKRQDSRQEAESNSRRFFLRKATVAIVVICLSFSGAIVKGDWESEANARIEQIRKRDAEITVVDSFGAPVAGINVEIEQIGHRFAFGTCISYWPLVIYSNYRNFILDHFEWAVCENETKWPSNEGTQDSEDYSQADYIYTWCNDNGIKMRGHCLFWEQWNQVQSWVQSLSYATYPTSSDLLTEVDERIDSAVNHYKDKFHNWDVDNEMLPTGSGNEFYNRLGEGGRVHMFERAKLRDPNCGMFMNEYSGNSFGGYDSGPYVSRASSLISMGAPIDGLGIQGHLGTNLVFYPQDYYDYVLEPLAALGLPIWATEFDASHSDETTSADNIENYFRICFSHPSVEGIIMWGFWQDSMWRENAYLVDSSWNLTERGERYEALMEEWTTTGSDVTDGSGEVAFRGFHGTYEITLSVPGEPAEIYTVELEPGETTEQFVLETELSIPLAWDDFESGDWTGGDGWSGDWSHSGDSTVTTNGTAYEGNYHLRLQAGTGIATRTVGMTDITNARLTFYWKADSFETVDNATVEIYDGSWHTVLTANSTTPYTPADIDLSVYNMVSDFQIRVASHMDGTSDYFYIDDIQVTGWLYGDLTYDKRVDMNDLPEFCEVWWLENDCNETAGLDLNDDCIINFYEYSFFAQNWLKEIQ